MPVGAGAVEIANSGHESEIASTSRVPAIGVATSNSITTEPSALGWNAVSGRIHAANSVGYCPESDRTSTIQWSLWMKCFDTPPRPTWPCTYEPGSAPIAVPWLKSSTHEFAPRTEVSTAGPNMSHNIGNAGGNAPNGVTSRSPGHATWCPGSCGT